MTYRPSNIAYYVDPKACDHLA